MKILVLNHEFPPVGGGASPVSFELCSQLAKLGHHVDVVTMHFKDTPRFEIIRGVNVYRTPALRVRPDICYTHEMATYIPGAISKVKSLIKKNNYNIMHCHFIIPGGILARLANALTGLDYIITAHGSDVPGFNTDRFQFQHKLTGPLLRAICKKAATVISPSNYLKNLIQKNIGQYPIACIPNGVDLGKFKSNLSNPKQKIILATGRLLRRKGFQTLIRAVATQNIGFEVHIAGDGPYKAELEQLARESKTKIVFHGWLEQGSAKLLDLYEKASIYVLVSEKENASVSLLEGMAARCAVITTNVSGCPETIGDAGFLIDYDNDVQLKNILIKLTQQPDLLREYADSAYKRVIEKFSWPQIAKQYIELYREINDKKLCNN